MPNPYYNPEKLGLEIVYCVDTAGDYEFSMLVIWKDAEARLYYATDSGCSCPSPFEDFHDVEDLERVTNRRDVYNALGSLYGARVDDMVRLIDVLDEYAVGR